MPFAHLPHRALLAVSGEEAEHFLEGLITSELPGAGEAHGSALLTPQGKILFTFLVSRNDSGFLIECDASERAGLMQRLSMYKLRAKVEVTADDRPVSAGIGNGIADQRHPEMGSRHYGDTNASASLSDYTHKRASLGVLEGPDEILASQDFPHDVALDLTGAVAFTKGCFVGQEVVSRVKHRGTARRRPVLVKADGLTTGTAIASGEREIGTVRLANDGEGVAVVRIDQVKDVQAITIGGKAASLSVPPYATYSIGGD
ncbi:MAG: YgfZ/GcvT domain-containing protein [Cohaesibacteraceae bacterium]